MGRFGTWLGVTFALLVVGGGLSFWYVQRSADLRKERQNELDSAKAVAETFLGAALTGDHASLFAVASKSYQGRLPKDQLDAKKVKLVARYKPDGWLLKEEELSGNGREAVFGGVFTWDLKQLRASTEDPMDFRLIVVKEAESELWRVDVFTSRDFPVVGSKKGHSLRQASLGKGDKM